MQNVDPPAVAQRKVHAILQSIAGATGEFMLEKNLLRAGERTHYIFRRLTFFGSNSEQGFASKFLDEASDVDFLCHYVDVHCYDVGGNCKGFPKELDSWKKRAKKVLGLKLEGFNPKFKFTEDGSHFEFIAVEIQIGDVKVDMTVYPSEESFDSNWEQTLVLDNTLNDFFVELHQDAGFGSTINVEKFMVQAVLNLKAAQSQAYDEKKIPRNMPSTRLRTIFLLAVKMHISDSGESWSWARGSCNCGSPHVGFGVDLLQKWYWCFLKGWLSSKNMRDINIGKGGAVTTTTSPTTSMHQHVYQNPKIYVADEEIVKGFFREFYDADVGGKYLSLAEETLDKLKKAEEDNKLREFKEAVRLKIKADLRSTCEFEVEKPFEVPGHLKDQQQMLNQLRDSLRFAPSESSQDLISWSDINRIGELDSLLLKLFKSGMEDTLILSEQMSRKLREIKPALVTAPIDELLVQIEALISSNSSLKQRIINHHRSFVIRQKEIIRTIDILECFLDDCIKQQTKIECEYVRMDTLEGYLRQPNIIDLLNDGVDIVCNMIEQDIVNQTESRIKPNNQKIKNKIAHKIAHLQRKWKLAKTLASFVRFDSNTQILMLGDNFSNTKILDLQVRHGFLSDLLEIKRALDHQDPSKPLMQFSQMTSADEEFIDGRKCINWLVYLIGAVFHGYIKITEKVNGQAPQEGGPYGTFGEITDLKFPGDAQRFLGILTDSVDEQGLTKQLPQILTDRFQSIKSKTSTDGKIIETFWDRLHSDARIYNYVIWHIYLYRCSSNDKMMLNILKLADSLKSLPIE